MNSTKALGSLKGVFPSIHQPLPLSKNESQKLLNALKTSFRSNLDKEYGWDSEKPSQTRNPTSSHNKAPSSHPTSIQQHHRPTDRHLDSILSNPLFKQAKQATERAAGLKRDPMDVFDEAVSKGMMTRKAATGCLIAKRRDILQSSSLSVSEAMAASGAGRRVVQWLRASGEERSGAFLGDDRLMKELVSFLVAEGLEEVIWTWAHHLHRMEGQLEVVGPQGILLSRLLFRLVVAKARVMDDKSLDAAYAALLRADHMWRESDNLPRILQEPWTHLSWASTVEAWKRPTPSNNLFEDYVRISEHLQSPVKLDLAHLDLYHPTKPSHEKALEFFNAESWVPAQGAGSSDEQALKSQKFINRVVSMGMDTVRHLTQIGRIEEADWVTRLLREKLSNRSLGYDSIPAL